MTANDNDHRGLLPAGLGDLLPPDAAREARAIDIAIERFAAFGYERVKPPLVEFEESLLGGPGAALGPQTFRLMDPVSQRMMGVRPDMTVQVARIAVTRLKHEPRRLRLSYGGNVIRVRGSALKPERQFAQVGAELIGALSSRADAEVIDELTIDEPFNVQELREQATTVERRDAVVTPPPATTAPAAGPLRDTAAGPAAASVAMVAAAALEGAVVDVRGMLGGRS